MFDVLLIIHTVLVLCLIGIILIQRSDDGGLGGLGGGGNQFMTGRASANLLTRTTAILAALFILSSLVLGIMSTNKASDSIVDKITVPQTAGGAGQAGAGDSVPLEDIDTVPLPEADLAEPPMPKPE